jgi:hypothetical protein
MSEHVDRARRSPLAPGGPVRAVVLVLLAYAVAGAAAGAVWEAVWTPPGQVIAEHQVFYDSYSSLRRVFSGTGLYVVIGALTSAVVALVVTLLARGRELLTLLLVVIGSAIGAAVMLKVGTALGPADPATLAEHTVKRTPVPGALTVQGKSLLGVKSAYLIWPMSSLLVLALVFFAWPSGPQPHLRDDTHPGDPREADFPGARHR